MSLARQYFTISRQLRFIALFILWTYYQIVTTDAPRSVTVFYTDVYMPFGTFIEFMMPNLIILGAVAIVVFGKQYPYRTILFGMVPQFIYSALSAGWFAGEYPTVNPAALYTHINLSVTILIIAGVSVYVAPNAATEPD